jgi:Mn2+/Fe2+ NRAMP family transporter
MGVKGLFKFKSPRRSGSPTDRGKVIDLPSRKYRKDPQRQSFKRIIPGIIAGVADLDPAAVLTATAGASFGLSLGWFVLFCVPILVAVFGVSARIGHDTNFGLITLVFLP